MKPNPHLLNAKETKSSQLINPLESTSTQSKIWHNMVTKLVSTGLFNPPLLIFCRITEQKCTMLIDCMLVISESFSRMEPKIFLLKYTIKSILQ